MPACYIIEGPLQCGRIYKDAEIEDRGFLIELASSLQCGRIYKDAEIVRGAKMSRKS